MKNASTDKTYCVNMSCSRKSECNRHKSNFIFENGMLYSFANFEEKKCIWKKVDNNGFKI